MDRPISVAGIEQNFPAGPASPQLPVARSRSVRRTCRSIRLVASDTVLSQIRSDELLHRGTHIDGGPKRPFIREQLPLSWFPLDVLFHAANRVSGWRRASRETYRRQLVYSPGASVTSDGSRPRSFNSKMPHLNILFISSTVREPINGTHSHLSNQMNDAERSVPV